MSQIYIIGILHLQYKSLSEARNEQTSKPIRRRRGVDPQAKVVPVHI